MDSGERYQEMCHAFIELIVSVGLLGSIIHQYPEEVQENYEERIVRYTTWATRQIEEVQQFGESWDDQ
jgi:hypothetical protein